MLRIGEYNSSKNRPIKIMLDSEDDVSYILTNAKEIINFFPDMKIFINKDKTKLEIQHYKLVKKQYDERKTTEDDIMIKYRNGIPTIVKKPKND